MAVCDKPCGPAKSPRRLKVRKLAMKKPKTLKVSVAEATKQIDEVKRLAKLKISIPKNRRNKIRISSDCTGIGSDIIALSQCGSLLKVVEGISWSDNDRSKRKMYNSVCNLLGHSKLGDVCEDMAERDFADDPEKKAAIDLYVAGYPCPSFSALGKKKGTLDPRGLVTLHGLKFIAAKRPRVCILENVRGLLSKKHTEVMDLMKEIFAVMGYKVFLQVLNSKDFGLPQSRPRVCIVAIQKDSIKKSFHWPKPWKLEKGSLKKFLDTDDHGDEVVPISVGSHAVAASDSQSHGPKEKSP